jgi:hypothetical protein
MTLEERLEKIECLLAILVERQTVKEFYEVEEFSRLVGKSCFTCREWCRLGRIRAEKKLSGRGAYARWVVPHVELLRYQRQGLLPDRRQAWDRNGNRKVVEAGWRGSCPRLKRSITNLGGKPREMER